MKHLLPIALLVFGFSFTANAQVAVGVGSAVGINVKKGDVSVGVGVGQKQIYSGYPSQYGYRPAPVPYRPYHSHPQYPRYRQPVHRVNYGYGAPYRSARRPAYHPYQTYGKKIRHPRKRRGGRLFKRKRRSASYGGQAGGNYQSPATGGYYGGDSGTSPTAVAHGGSAMDPNSGYYGKFNNGGYAKKPAYGGGDYGAGSDGYAGGGYGQCNPSQSEAHAAINATMQAKFGTNLVMAGNIQRAHGMIAAPNLRKSHVYAHDSAGSKFKCSIVFAMDKGCRVQTKARARNDVQENVAQTKNPVLKAAKWASPKPRAWRFSRCYRVKKGPGGQEIVADQGYDIPPPPADGYPPSPTDPKGDTYAGPGGKDSKGQTHAGPVYKDSKGQTTAQPAPKGATHAGFAQAAPKSSAN